MDRKDHLHFWGKAGGDRLGEPAWHPVPYHCLDAAAVADRLLIDTPGRLREITRLLGTSTANASRVLPALVALHDIGKFSGWFQRKSEQAYVRSAQEFLGPYQPAPSSWRDVDGYALSFEMDLAAHFAPAFDEWSCGDFVTLWRAIAGHRGQPANDIIPQALNPGFKKKSISAVEDFAREIGTLIGPFEAVEQPRERNLAAISWHLAGLTVLSVNWPPF